MCTGGALNPTAITSLSCMQTNINFNGGAFLYGQTSCGYVPPTAAPTSTPKPAPMLDSQSFFTVNSYTQANCAGSQDFALQYNPTQCLQVATNVYAKIGCTNTPVFNSTLTTLNPAMIAFSDAACTNLVVTVNPPLSCPTAGSSQFTCQKAPTMAVANIQLFQSTTCNGGGNASATIFLAPGLSAAISAQCLAGNSTYSEKLDCNRILSPTGISLVAYNQANCQGSQIAGNPDLSVLNLGCQQTTFKLQPNSPPLYGNVNCGASPAATRTVSFAAVMMAVLMMVALLF